jgi:hypothetical protein
MRVTSVEESDGSIRVLIPGMTLVSETNRRDHWAAKHRRAASQRAIAAAAVRMTVGKLEGPIRVELVYHSTRKMDAGNIAAAFKAVQDGVADALGVDDGDDSYYQWVYTSAPDGSRGRTCVELRFTRRTKAES